MFPGKHGVRLAVLALALVALTACRQKMANQARYDPLERSDFFADGMAARPRIEGTVARGEISGNPFLDSGKIDGRIADGFPLPVTRELIDRGHSRFDIYCAQCHGRIGDGNGMIPSRGYRRPPSFHTDKLRTAPTGHFFDVMTNGFGAMPPYRTMINTHDRWAIVAYIRALQLSQNTSAADLDDAARAKLVLSGVEGLDAPAEPAHGAEGGHH
ncbi:MAG TPA: cytochrome c [Thermoanaerobaculia bacterium]|nr:cytochrome c [Thermoanaerobaculia bacterium]